MHLRKPKEEHNGEESSELWRWFCDGRAYTEHMRLALAYATAIVGGVACQTTIAMFELRGLVEWLVFAAFVVVFAGTAGVIDSGHRGHGRRFSA
jgi:hypothetical protein